MARHTVLVARDYIEAIRNQAKRQYAARYFAYLRGAALEPEPDGLSVMGAQAVRMRLEVIYQGEA